jgi:hypothetical protein
MIRRFIFIGAMAIARSALAQVNVPGADGNLEIVVADELRTAFYEKAPSSMAIGIRRAVGL